MGIVATSLQQQTIWLTAPTGKYQKLEKASAAACYKNYEKTSAAACYKNYDLFCAGLYLRSFFVGMIHYWGVLPNDRYSSMDGANINIIYSVSVRKEASDNHPRVQWCIGPMPFALSVKQQKLPWITFDVPTDVPHFLKTVWESCESHWWQQWVIGLVDLLFLGGSSDICENTLNSILMTKENARLRPSLWATC